MTKEVNKNSRKSLHEAQHQSQQKQEKKNYEKAEVLSCKKTILGERLKGYSWYHHKNKEIISVCKINKGENLRYFAMKEEK